MKLKILGHKYDVRFDGKLDLNERTPAQINFNSLTVQICPIYPKTRQEEGLIHEIIEAINYHTSMKLEHSHITILAENLYQVLKDNKLLNQNGILDEEKT